MRAQELYRALFGQAEDLMRGKELIVVPTGALTQLPFGVLVTDGPAPSPSADPADVYRQTEWLGRRTAISVLPAVSSLVALRRHAGNSAAPKPYLGLGNPLLDGPDARYSEMARRAKAFQACAIQPKPARMRIAMASGPARSLVTTGGLADVAVLRSQSPLPETADELCAVATVLNAGRDAVKLGSAATEADLKRMNDRKELTGYRVLHFATHGVLAGEAVGISEPGLLFSPPAKASELDDGYLSAAEISGLNLDANLVILSACNTAAGDAGDTDALAGLARSFFYAGARALFVSHWAVNSQATVSLITTALATMARAPGISYAQALREAMVSLIDSTEPNASHPAYWAPFVVAGVERAERQ